METCDISLVKKEIVELIKTEPQNEDDIDMCGQSRIKIEFLWLKPNGANEATVGRKAGPAAKQYLAVGVRLPGHHSTLQDLPQCTE
uniref:Uncharacterized protein n=1 Tax=Timema poppense TaxID=170557 RepID=A0A7R9CZJ3_TIMPO|nr:unnamed protein product [Timema poppensis]